MLQRIPRMVVLAGALAACGEPSGPGSLIASLGIAAVFAPGTVANAVTFDNARVRLFRTPTERAADTIVVFPPDSNHISVRLRVPLKARSERLQLLVELRLGGLTLYNASESVQLFAEAQGPTPTPHPVLTYVGPGANVTTLRLTPKDTILTFGDSFTFRLSATDALGAVVNGPVVLWNTVPVVAVSGAGLLTAPSARGVIKLRVFTPTGVGDSTTVRFVPPPSLLAPVGGGGQTAPAGSTLGNPFVVQVRGADGFGVPGVAVHFRALTAGGAVRDAVVISDDAGFALTVLTLGPAIGPYAFEAAVTGIPVVVVNALATP